MPPIDRSGGGSGEPAIGWFAISPSDIADLPLWPRAIYVGVSGSIRMRSVNGEEETFDAVPVGEHAFRPVRILATGTTATGIKGLY